uniref:Uncharacterized protein n=1 Tax=Oryza glumipatula TaxID=40148 RepID=A0A0D9ZIW4_9ORYZ
MASPSSLTADAILDDTIKIIADAVRPSFKAPSGQDDDTLTTAVAGDAAERAATATQAALAPVLLGLIPTTPVAGDAISSPVPPPVPPTIEPSTTAIPPPPASTPAPATHLPPEILALLARLGITTMPAAPTQDAAAPPLALDAEAITNLHSQAILNVKALVPLRFAIQDGKLTRSLGCA